MAQAQWTIVDDAFTAMANALHEYMEARPDYLISDAREYGFDGDNAREALIFMEQTISDMIEGQSDDEAIEVLNDKAQAYTVSAAYTPKRRQRRR